MKTRFRSICFEKTPTKNNNIKMFKERKSGVLIDTKKYLLQALLVDFY